MMKILSLASILYVDMADKNEIFGTNFGYSISGKDIRAILTSKSYLNLFGQIKVANQLNHPYFISIEEERTELALHKVNNLSELAEASHSALQSFCTCLWLVIDNSLNIQSVCVHTLSDEDSSITRSIENTKYNLFTNSRGEYSTLVITKEIMKSVDEVSKKLYTVLLNNTGSHKPNGPARNIPDIPYNEHSRLNRIILFIVSARSQAWLPLKISFYIVCLESLFTTNNVKISHKVSDRTSKLLGGDARTIQENYKLIKKGYTVRSNFVHGQSLTTDFSTQESLINLSQKIDDIVRRTVLKFINDYPYTFKYDMQQLETWLTNTF